MTFNIILAAEKPSAGVGVDLSFDSIFRKCARTTFVHHFFFWSPSPEEEEEHGL